MIDLKKSVFTMKNRVGLSDAESASLVEILGSYHKEELGRVSTEATGENAVVLRALWTALGLYRREERGQLA